MIKKIVTVAGSDSSGGAGIQADLKTFEEYGTFGFSALTSIVTMTQMKDGVIWLHQSNLIWLRDNLKLFLQVARLTR